MLIFQPHIPHMITNSWWPLHVENYTSEGSVSISTCDFVEVTVSASTVDKMLLEVSTFLPWHPRGLLLEGSQNCCTQEG